MEPINKTVGDYTITTDKQRMNVHRIHQWLSTASYWAKDIPFQTVERSFQHSYCIAILHGDDQVGYARLITDYTTFGYLADVYVLEAHRGKGLSKAMLDVLFSPNWVQGLRRIMLATSDAHGLYRKYGFTESKNPEKLMEVTRPTIYSQNVNN